MTQHTPYRSNHALWLGVVIATLCITWQGAWAQGTLSDSLVLRNTVNGRLTIHANTATLLAGSWRMQMPLAGAPSVGSLFLGDNMGAFTDMKWLSAGTPGQILTINGAGYPAWTTSTGSGILEEVTAGQYNIRRKSAYTNGIVGTPGQYSIDLMGFRSAASQTASGGFSGIISGAQNTIAGEYSLIGSGSQNSIGVAGLFSFIGTGNTNSVTGKYSSIVSGLESGITGDFSLASGQRSYVSGSFAVALGNKDTVTAKAGIAIGDSNRVSGENAIAMGMNNRVTGIGSAALGMNNVVTGAESMAFGKGANVSNSKSIVFMHSPSLFDGDRTKVGIDINSPATSLDVDGGITIREGANIVVNANNFPVGVGNRSYIVLNPAGANRLGLTLTPGLAAGQILILRVLNGQPNFIAMNDVPAANVNLTGAWVAGADDTITLIWSGALWVELSRSNN